MTEEEYQKLIDEAKALVVKKHKDYQNNGVQLYEYFPFGHKSYAQMIHIKATRVRALADSHRPTNESVKDTILDLINYAVFYLSWLESNK